MFFSSLSRIASYLELSYKSVSLTLAEKRPKSVPYSPSLSLDLLLQFLLSNLLLLLISGAPSLFRALSGTSDTRAEFPFTAPGRIL